MSGLVNSYEKEVQDNVDQRTQRQYLLIFCKLDLCKAEMKASAIFPPPIKDIFSKSDVFSALVQSEREKVTLSDPLTAVLLKILFIIDNITCNSSQYLAILHHPQRYGPQTEKFWNNGGC